MRRQARGRQAEAREWLSAVATREPGNAAVRVELARLLAAGGTVRGRTRRWRQRRLRLAPDDPRAGEQLASILADAGDADR